MSTTLKAFPLPLRKNKMTQLEVLHIKIPLKFSFLPYVALITGAQSITFSCFPSFNLVIISWIAFCLFCLNKKYSFIHSVRMMQLLGIRPCARQREYSSEQNSHDTCSQRTVFHWVIFLGTTNILLLFLKGCNKCYKIKQIHVWWPVGLLRLGVQKETH